jgi:mannose-1-phosphate guanylyltransferase/mannose-6-phosphate isomerase
VIVVIIAGGSGSRLWPLSTPDFPKHLLKINGDENSLLQNTYRRVKQLAEQVYVVSEASHIQHVREQLSELPEDSFIVEPGRRGTASCIVLALATIQQTHDADVPVAFVHADHFIRDEAGFAYSFGVATAVSSQEGKIVLVGVEPDYPATGFGYIQKGEMVNKQTLAYQVESFKEKPDFQTAKHYVASGKYLWNCGYFVGSVGTFKKAMEQHAPDLFDNYNKLVALGTGNISDTYLSFENQAIDYALIEKVPDLLVVPASFDWMDLGTFTDIAKAAGSDECGNLIVGKVELEDVQNSLIQNNEDRPLAVIGLDNVVVVNTPDGILVARKDLAQKVGDVSKRFSK